MFGIAQFRKYLCTGFKFDRCEVWQCAEGAIFFFASQAWKSVERPFWEAGIERGRWWLLGVACLLELCVSI